MEDLYWFYGNTTHLCYSCSKSPPYPWKGRGDRRRRVKYLFSTFCDECCWYSITKNKRLVSVKPVTWSNLYASSICNFWKRYILIRGGGEHAKTYMSKSRIRLLLLQINGTEMLLDVCGLLIPWREFGVVFLIYIFVLISDTWRVAS